MVANLYEYICALGAEADPTAAQFRDTAFRNFETLIRLYYLRHGFDYADTFLGQPLIQLGFMSLNRVQALTSGSNSNCPAPDPSSSALLAATRSTLALAAKGMHDQGRSHFIDQVTLRVLRAKMGPDERQLLAQVLGDGGDGGRSRSASPDDGRLASVSDMDRAVAAAEARMREVRSRFLPSAVSFADDPELHRLGQLVSEQMRLDGDEAGPREEDEDEEEV